MQSRSSFIGGLGLLDPTVQVDDEVSRVVFIFIQSVAVFKSLYTYIRPCKMVTCFQNYVCVNCLVVKKWLHQCNNDRTELCGSLKTLSEIPSFICLLQGKVFSSIQPQTNINDVCIYPNTGENNCSNNVVISYFYVVGPYKIVKVGSFKMISKVNSCQNL